MKPGWACFALAWLAVQSPLHCARIPEMAPGGELRFCVHGEPRNFNPLMVSEEPEEVVRFLTGGVLIRLNRQTQVLEPALAESWRVSGTFLSPTPFISTISPSSRPTRSARVLPTN